jgi:MoaA/NifB/PqqE/SkfB family radical SAM enzyme
MTVYTDRSADSNFEATLMRRIRSGEIAPADVASHIPPFFLKVQIQTVSPCNASCTMCPWPSTKDLPQGAMSDAVFATLIDQMVGRGVERVSLFLMNEPLLDRKLAARTALVKRRMPESATVIYTNGSLLDAACALALAEAGLDELNVSVNGFDRDTYVKWMPGIDYDRVMANLRAVAALRRQGRLGGMRVRLAVLDLPGARDGAAAFAAETDLEISLRPTTNRAGSVDPAALGVHHELDDQPIACQRPFVKAYVLYNGDLVLCNCDWRRTTILGNLRDRSLAELWHDARLNEIRAAHARRLFPADLLCAKCDYPYMR